MTLSATSMIDLPAARPSIGSEKRRSVIRSAIRIAPKPMIRKGG